MRTVDHEVLFSPEKIGEMVRELADAVDSRSVDSFLVLTVLKGAAIFSSDLVRAMATPTELAYISASSYVDGFVPGEDLTVRLGENLEVRDRDVLIVEDIVDTGRTIREIRRAVEELQPRSTTVVSLVNKIDRRDTNFQPDFTGFEITHEFIYGYGLDWDERFRDLPYIALARV